MMIVDLQNESLAGQALSDAGMNSRAREIALQSPHRFGVFVIQEAKAIKYSNLRSIRAVEFAERLILASARRKEVQVIALRYVCSDIRLRLDAAAIQFMKRGESNGFFGSCCALP